MALPGLHLWEGGQSRVGLRDGRTKQDGKAEWYNSVGAKGNLGGTSMHS